MNFVYLLISLLILFACSGPVSFSPTPKNLSIYSPQSAIRSIPNNCSSSFLATVLFNKLSNGSFTLKECRTLKWRAPKNEFVPGDALPCTASLQNGAVSFSFNNTSCSGVVNLGASGELPINYNCTGEHNRFEGYSLTSRKSVEISGTACAPAQNLAPTVQSPGDQNNQEGNSVSFTVTATDPEGAPVIFSASGLPPGLSINSGGLISGIVSAGASVGSPYTVTVRASDGVQTGAATFSWQISQTALPPNIVNPGPRTDEKGSAVNLQIQASSPQGHSLSLSATNLPPGLSISTSGLISGTISSSAIISTPYAVTVTVRDVVNGLTSSANFNWSIIEPTNFAILTWDANPDPNLDLAGYKIYMREASGLFTTPAVVLGKVTTYRFDNLPRGKTYYFAVTAYNTSGNESLHSNEVFKVIP